MRVLTLTTRAIISYTYKLFTGCKTRTEKHFPRGLRSGPTPKAEGTYILVRTDLNGK